MKSLYFKNFVCRELFKHSLISFFLKIFDAEVTRAASKRMNICACFTSTSYPLGKRFLTEVPLSPQDRNRSFFSGPWTHQCNVMDPVWG